jgi:hypothetical protein
MLQAKGKSVLGQIFVLVPICPREIHAESPGIEPATSNSFFLDGIFVGD